MYLNLLNLKDKKLFFALASRQVKVDGKVSQYELKLLELFETEMDIPKIDTMEKAELDDIIAGITDDIIVKKVVIFELVSLACVDFDYADVEKDFIHHVKEKLNMDDSLFKAIEKQAVDMINLTNKIQETILGQ